LKGGKEHVIFNKDRQEIKGIQNITVEGERYVLVNSKAFYEFKDDLEEKMKNMMQEVEDLKRVQAKTVTHHVDRHNLDADDNNRACNNFLECPVMGVLHSTQNKTFLKGG